MAFSTVDADQQVDMVPHYHEVVHRELTLTHVAAQHVGKQVGHAIGLQERFAFGCSGGYEECASLSLDVLRGWRDGLDIDGDLAAAAPRGSGAIKPVF